MLIALAWCAAGLALLILGAELIVRGGTDVAARLGARLRNDLDGGLMV